MSRRPRKITLDANTKIFIVFIEIDGFICQIARFDWECYEPKLQCSHWQDEAEASTLNTMPK